jgi:hypothetical protein
VRDRGLSFPLPLVLSIYLSLSIFLFLHLSVSLSLKTINGESTQYIDSFCGMSTLSARSGVLSFPLEFDFSAEEKEYFNKAHFLNRKLVKSFPVFFQ